VRNNGKGDVTEVRLTNGTAAASYTYAPFGKILTTSGSYVQPFRFQTKLYHAKSNLGYWGYRWYDYKTGRWISRDGLARRAALTSTSIAAGLRSFWSIRLGLRHTFI